jgi:hypothetical protein
MLKFLNLINILLNQTKFDQLIDFDQDVMNVNYLKNRMHSIQEVLYWILLLIILLIYDIY